MSERDTSRPNDGTIESSDKEYTTNGENGGSVQGSDSESPPSPSRTRRPRRPRQFPAVTFQEALLIGEAIQQYAAGQRIRRLTLFEHLGRSADSRQSRALVTNSNQYGITTGGYTAEWLELTPNGRIATSDEVSSIARLRARFQLAIEQIEPFSKLYEQYKDSRVPAPSVMVGFIQENGVAEELARECVDTFIVNAKYLGLLQSLAGAERLLTLEHVLDDMQQPATSGEPELISSVPETSETPAAAVSRTLTVATVVTEASLDKICFYIAPIGADESIERKHSDLFMGSPC